MKKELLVASALVTTLGAAGIAEAASATFSGHHKVGVSGTDLDSSSTNTQGASRQSSFTVSISETTDSGIKISTGFDLAEESTTAATVDQSGITLTFNDGSKLDLIEAGTAAATHAVAIPGAGGEQGITATSLNAAPTALTMGAGADNVGFEWHSTADAFGVDGFKASLSASSNTDAVGVDGATTTAALESSYSVGVTYVTDAGDSTVTVGGGYQHAASTNTTATATDVLNAGLSAVTGDLTVAAGYMSGSYFRGGATNRNQMDVTSASMTKIGVKYVSGDLTFNVGMSDAEGVDSSTGVAGTSSADTRESAGASVAYAVASGVTATVGYTTQDDSDEGSGSTNTSGSSWYVGATISF